VSLHTPVKVKGKGESVSVLN